MGPADLLPAALKQRFYNGYVFSYFCYYSSPHHLLGINMLSWETGACISSPTAYFLLQQIYFSATVRECYLVLLSGVTFQWLIHWALPYCVQAKPVKDVKDLLVLRENSTFKALYSVAAPVYRGELSSEM